jgi:hypothetical protein
MEKTSLLHKDIYFFGSAGRIQLAKFLKLLSLSRSLHHCFPLTQVIEPEFPQLQYFEKSILGMTCWNDVLLILVGDAGGLTHHKSQPWRKKRGVRNTTDRWSCRGFSRDPL